MITLAEDNPPAVAGYTAPVQVPAAAVRANRLPVTVAQWAARPDDLIDEIAYYLSRDAEDLGLDPWRLIESADARTSGGKFDLWFYAGNPVTTPGEFVIYVSAKHHAAVIGAAANV